MTFKRNHSIRFKLTHKDKDQNPVDLTDFGITIYMVHQIKPREENIYTSTILDGSIVITDAALGIFTFEKFDLSEMLQGLYSAEIEFTDSTGYKYGSGIFEVNIEPALTEGIKTK